MLDFYFFDFVSSQPFPSPPTKKSLRIVFDIDIWTFVLQSEKENIQNDLFSYEKKLHKNLEYLFHNCFSCQYSTLSS